MDRELPSDFMLTPLRRPHFVDLHQALPIGRVRAELAEGLCAATASIAPKFFYDALGSRLFDAITELPEYYPTRTEASIFEADGAAMAERLGRGRTLVDLGAGNCEKARRLLPLLQPERYVALDISSGFLRQALGALQREHPALPIVGMGVDLTRPFTLGSQLGDGGCTLFYPGSSIGNFAPGEAQVFLRRMREAVGGGNLLIGVDLVKDVAVLEAAYDDALGVTAAFNRNALLHVNRLLGSDFAAADWRHVAFFERAHSRIEMHLEATRALSVQWPGGERRFVGGERIHTEHSYKYTLQAFEALLERAGWRDIDCWTDERRWFAVFAAA
jgi:dimethylhistidine N-methyltransferase